jgi:hypothetical protein
VGAATDGSGNYFVALGDLLLDAEVEIGRSGCLLGYLSLEVLSTGFFSCKGVTGYEVRSEQFVGYVHVPPVVDFFVKAAHQGFVILFDRHSSFLLANLRSSYGLTP